MGGGWVKSYLSYQNRQIGALDETADAPQSSLFSLLSPLFSLLSSLSHVTLSELTSSRGCTQLSTYSLFVSVSPAHVLPLTGAPRDSHLKCPRHPRTWFWFRVAGRLAMETPHPSRRPATPQRNVIALLLCRAFARTILPGRPASPWLPSS